MQVPLELELRNVTRTPAIEGLVRRRADKLERFCDHISACRVAVEKPHEHPSSGSPYRVRIDVTVPPKHELVVDRTPEQGDEHEKLDTSIGRAFEALERQVKELNSRQHREVKTHEEKRALVVRLFEEEGYGFLKTAEGREIYFHANAVAGDAFARLAVGTEVRFAETMGEMGPQATTVQAVGKPGAPREGDQTPEEMSPPHGWEP